MHLFLAIAISIAVLVLWLLPDQKLWHTLLPNLEPHSVNMAKSGGTSDCHLNIIAAATNAISLLMR
jgi:hypothetical protein